MFLLVGLSPPPGLMAGPGSPIGEIKIESGQSCGHMGRLLAIDSCLYRVQSKQSMSLAPIQSAGHSVRAFSQDTQSHVPTIRDWL